MPDIDVLLDQIAHLPTADEDGATIETITSADDPLGRLLRCFIPRPGLTVAQVAHTLGVDGSAAGRVCARLLERSIIQTVGERDPAVYRLHLSPTHARRHADELWDLAEEPPV